VTNLNVEQATDGAPIIRSLGRADHLHLLEHRIAEQCVGRIFPRRHQLDERTPAEPAMTALGNGDFTVDLPQQLNRTVVRYRIRANRGDGVEVVSPRRTIPRWCRWRRRREAWHAYFVTPVRTSAKPIYDCFISQRAS
jgi:hypothetical protein